MPLTEAQVAKARTFPGCNDITADNAVDRLFLASERLSVSAGTAISDNEVLSAENKRLGTRVEKLDADLKAAQTTVKQVDPAVIKTNAKMARMYLKSGITAQAFSPAQGEKIAGLLIGANLDSNEPQFAVSALAPDAKGDCLATSILEALASGGPAPTVGKDAKAQIVPKVATGAPEGESDLESGLKQAKAYQDQQLAARGFSTAK